MMGVYVFLGVAAIPFIYYLIAIYSSWRYFNQPTKAMDPAFTPAISNLKPIRGLDPEAYENLESFCRQDYPDYEIVFCVDSDDAAVISVIDRLKANFPQRRIRMLRGSGRVATNDKVAKLARLVAEAEHEVVVISDSDVRVQPDYLRQVTAPLQNPRVGAVTCFYAPTEIKTFTDHLQTAGMTSDFYAGVLVDWQLEGIKFALGTTIATTRTHLAGFGGYTSIENQPADDLLVGRSIAAQGYEVVLLPYTIETVPDYHSISALLHKRLRWMVVMRHMRPSGHLGLLLTPGSAVVDSSDCSTSDNGGRDGIFGNVHIFARGDDLGDWHPRNEAAPLLETDAVDSGMGCCCVPHLVGQLNAEKYPMARRGLLYPRRKACAGIECRQCFGTLNTVTSYCSVHERRDRHVTSKRELRNGHSSSRIPRSDACTPDRFCLQPCRNAGSTQGQVCTPHRTMDTDAVAVREAGNTR